MKNSKQHAGFVYAGYLYFFGQFNALFLINTCYYTRKICEICSKFTRGQN